jgi:hypothetical protein
MTPLLKILHHIYPDLEFVVGSEVSLFTNIRLDEDDIPVIRAEARVDQVMYVGETNAENEIILLVEHEKPGTLRRTDWTGNYSSGGWLLVHNAETISQQSRKYMAAAEWNIIGVYDSCALAGMMLDWKDFASWGTRKVLEVKTFYEDRPEQFLMSLLAMVVTGLTFRKLI